MLTQIDQFWNSKKGYNTILNQKRTFIDEGAISEKVHLHIISTSGVMSELSRRMCFPLKQGVGAEKFNASWRALIRQRRRHPPHSWPHTPPKVPPTTWTTITNNAVAKTIIIINSNVVRFFPVTSKSTESSEDPRFILSFLFRTLWNGLFCTGQL